MAQTYDKITASSTEFCVKKALAIYQKTFGISKTYQPNDLVCAQAPGRVNIIGGHTDYCGGFVLPLALELKTYCIGTFNNTNTVNIVSANIDKKFNKFSFNLKSGNDENNNSIEKVDNSGPYKWANYVLGVIAHFHDQEALAGNKGLAGFNLAIHSEVPLGGGLSSSASIEVSVYTFLEELFNSKTSKVQKALNCQKAEHNYPGLPCGIMDQYISANAEKGKVTLIDCETLENSCHIDMGSSNKAGTANANNAVFLITNTNVKHELTGTEYPERKFACEKAAKICGKPNLRQTTLADLLRNKDLLDETTLKRAEHVIQECSRTKQAAVALKNVDFSTLGQLMLQSHDSLSHKYNVSCPEQDKLIEIAKTCQKSGIDGGCFGGRMTGGGFGGCTIMLVEKEKVERVIERLDKEYFEEFGKRATFYITEPGEGAGPVDLGQFV